METLPPSNPALVPGFTSAATQKEIIAQLEFTAPIFLKEKGFCLLVVSQQGKDAFYAWQERDRFSPYNQGTADVGGGFFGIRIPDDPKIIEEVLDILDLKGSGRYLIAHRPQKRGQPVTFDRPLALV